MIGIVHLKNLFSRDGSDWIIISRADHCIWEGAVI